LRAPATNISDSRRTGPTGGGGQHLPKIPDYLQKPVAGRNHDLFDETAQGLTRGLALLLILVLQRCRELHRLLLEDIRHFGMKCGRGGSVADAATMAPSSTLPRSSALPVSKLHVAKVGNQVIEDLLLADGRWLRSRRKPQSTSCGARA